LINGAALAMMRPLDAQLWCGVQRFAPERVMTTIETDYLIIGAGAVGLAFADTLLSETNAHITIVDRHGKPGGHWNDAYSFVALHQPSAFYGVNGLPLDQGRKETHGVNAGLFELASGPEVSGYFDTVMRQRLLPSGRVAYYPMSEHIADGRFLSILSGAETNVKARRRIVDATFYGTSVPATHTPKFTVAPGVTVVPPNALPHLAQAKRPQPPHYVIVGAGKTAMDVGVWLLQSGLPADRISWIMPRDSWLLNRLHTQPGEEFFAESIGGQATQMEACAAATSPDDLCQRLEAAGILLRIDPTVRPSMMHYATISVGEVEILRRIKHVIRDGRVTAIDAGGVTIADKQIPFVPGTLYIDCTATAVERRRPVPVFQDGRIVLQIVRAPQPAFSAALVAAIEARDADDAAKNALATPVPFPDRVEDWPRTLLANFANEGAWSKDKPLRQWIRQSRLDGFGKVAASAGTDPAKLAVLGRLQGSIGPAVANLMRLAR
jgi:hypothetical protein